MTLMQVANAQRQALHFLRQALGDPEASFRDGQWEAIEALVERQARLLVVQRTGWGKSAVYFIATQLLRERGAGPTLIISPLLSLMRNQLEAARRFGLRAETMNSSNVQEWRSITARLGKNMIDVLLIAPERLANHNFQERVLRPLASRIGLLVVDEAHCISDWGHDFRPDYGRIGQVLPMLASRTPVLATTATANTRVIDDVLAQLGPSVELMRGPLVRESLRLQNINLPTHAARLAWLAEHLPRLPGSGIVYTLTIADARQVAKWLRQHGIDAHAYYSGLTNDRREALERQLLNNELKVLVATTALSMGFDKADLHWVIHYHRPGSVIHYYQQVGRAGRAIEAAYGLLLGGPEDQAISDYFIRTSMPLDTHVSEVLRVLRKAVDGLTTEMIERELNLTADDISKVLTYLAAKSPGPVHISGTRWYATGLVYFRDEARIEWLRAIRNREQAQMAAYAKSHGCLMQFLTEALGAPEPLPCGKCANCSSTPLPTTYRPALALKADGFLRRNDQWIEPRTAWPVDALAAHGWHGIIRPELRAEHGRALSRWGDDGWGSVVRKGKQRASRPASTFDTILSTLKWLCTGRQPTMFDEPLIAAVVGLVCERWRPTPFPTWVTCVPSLKHPTLVPNLARRIAQELRLPLVPCVRKIRDTQPQKTMQNDYQQAHNLAGTFAVEAAAVRDGPVLLVDDMIDSGWTFTVITALLRSAGAGPVFPLALAVTSRTSDG